MATPLLSRLGMFAAKAESTSGTWTAPANTDATFRVLNVKYTPDIKVAERNTLRVDLSRNAHLIGQTLAKLEFDLEFKVSSAVAGTADAYGILLEACGLNETATPSTNVVYNPSTKLADHKTLSIYAWIGGSGPAGSGMRVGMRGCMGSVRFSGKVGEPLMMHFEFMGVGDRDHSAMKPQITTFHTGITYETGVPPIFQAATFSWDTETVNLTNDFTLDFGTQVTAREDITAQEGVSHYMVTGRGVTGSFSPELHLTGGKNHLEQLNLGSEVAISCILTHTGVRTLAIAIPNAQLTNVQSGDRNGIATWACTFAANASSAGDDEVTLTII